MTGRPPTVPDRFRSFADRSAQLLYRMVELPRQFERSEYEGGYTDASTITANPGPEMF